MIDFVCLDVIETTVLCRYLVWKRSFRIILLFALACFRYKRCVNLVARVGFQLRKRYCLPTARQICARRSERANPLKVYFATGWPRSSKVLQTIKQIFPPAQKEVVGIGEIQLTIGTRRRSRNVENRIPYVTAAERIEGSMPSRKSFCVANS
jgi:hypothetical protein